MSAGVVSDHSGNFPRDFEVCPECGAKGVYRCSPVAKNGEIIIQGYWRCKYCKERFPLLQGQEQGLSVFQRKATEMQE